METQIHKQSILNVIKAAAADLDTTSQPDAVVLPGLNPIPTVNITEVVENAYAAEVRQFVTVTIPTITLSTLTVPSVYGVQGGELQMQDVNKNTVKTKQFRMTAPIVTGGSALIDRTNVAYVIGWKIMQHARANSINVQAGPTAVFTNATTAYAGVIGDVIVGLTSGARAVVAVVTNATTKTVIMLSSTDFTDTEAVSINGVVTTTTAATNVYSGDLGILDDAGYFPAKGHRKGASSWQAGTGITTVTVTTAAVYGFGIGSRMLQDVPVLESTSPNLHSGQWNFATNNLPLAASNYNQFIIRYTNDTQPDSQSTIQGKRSLSQAIWLDTGAANYAALRAAIIAL